MTATSSAKIQTLVKELKGYQALRLGDLVDSDCFVVSFGDSQNQGEIWNACRNSDRNKEVTTLHHKPRNTPQ